MANPNWTAHQKLAIHTLGDDLLLTASAGSGKTAVLSQRCVYLLTEALQPCDIDELLVMTFAEDAAAEMRTRIARVLMERVAQYRDDRIRRQLVLLDKATISTIHSFCSSILREYFYLAGIDPDYEVLDEYDAELIRLQTAEEVLEDAYEVYESDPTQTFSRKFARFIRTYGVQSDRIVVDMILDLDRFMQTLVDPQGWRLACQDELNYAKAGQVDQLRLIALQGWMLNDRLGQVIQRLQSLIQYCREQAGLDKYESYLTHEILPELMGMAWALDQGLIETTIDRIHLFAFPRKPGIKDKTPGSEFVFKQIDAVKKQYQQIAEHYALSRQTILRQQVAGADCLEVFLELQDRYRQRYEALKQTRNALDFSDLEHKILALLLDDTGQPSEAAEQLRHRYRHILVDEYQDISPVQEAIIRAICRTTHSGRGGNVFMVGDVKQSIYSFRQADPEIIQDKARRFSTLEPDQLAQGAVNLRLNENFRSRRHIIEGINTIFSRCMTESFCGIDYGGREQLIYGAAYYETESSQPPGVIEVHLLEKDARSDVAPAEGDDPDSVESGGGDDSESDIDLLDRTRREATLAALRIRELLGLEGGPGMEVYDARLGASRPVRCRDIVVLMRSMKMRAELYCEVFHRMGVPVHAELSSGFFTAVEIQDMIHLMKLLDNPRQDIPLAAALRSPIVGLDESQLAAIHQAALGEEFFDACQKARHWADKENPVVEKLNRFFEQLEDWRTAARQGHLGDLVWRIYHETNLPAWMAGMHEGRQRYSNLLAFYEQACRFDRFTSQGLARFLHFIDKVRQEEGDFGPAPVLTDADDVVRIMTIHKSKGLEFPVVILADLGKQFNLQGGSGSFVYDRADRGGIGMRLIDPVSRDSWPQLSYKIITDQQRRRKLAEEMRILYVGMTRAREHLILTGTGSLDKIRDVMRFCRDLPGETLQDFILDGARCALDWLMPALATHPSMQAFAGEPGCEVITDQEAPARFSLFRYDVGDLTAMMNRAGQNKQRFKPVWDIARCLTAGDAEAVGQADRIIERLSWRYPCEPLTQLVATASVTSLKRSRLPADPDDYAVPVGITGKVPAMEPELFDIIPRFMAESQPGLSAAQIGSATHLVLQRLELTGRLDDADVRSQVARLVTLKQMTIAEAEQVNISNLVNFFAGGTGRLLTRAPGKVYREWPFALQLPVREIWPGTDCDQGVLLRGIIDCLIETPEGYIILDYKTDQIELERLPQRAESYRLQMQMYCQAVTEILKRPVIGQILYFLALNQAYEID